MYLLGKLYAQPDGKLFVILNPVITVANMV